MKIVYIMSSSFSGSTILDIMLGNGRNVLSLGEISKGLRRQGSVCSCGYGIEECPLWRKIKERYQLDMEWSELQRELNYWDHFYRIPQMLFRTKSTRMYKKKMEVLFDNLLQIENKEILVDSTKEIGRAFFVLTRFPSTRVLHVVRDFDGILRSNYWRLKDGNVFQFQGRKWSISGNYFIYLFIYTMGWIVGNVFAEIMKLVYRNRVMTVRYDDLCARPEIVLKRISEFIEADLSEVIQLVQSKCGLKVGHLIGGNKIRRNRSVVFDPKAGKNKPPVPGRYRIFLQLLTFPVRAYYRYGAGI